MADEPRVVIVGGGFAGLGVVRKLKKAPVRVTLIDKNDYHSFLPLLYQVATDELTADEVGFPLPEMLNDHSGWEFHQANVTGIDLATRMVTAEGIDPVSYDYLVIALGAVANFFGTKGAAENAFPLYSMRDALRLREHVLGRLEATEKDPTLVDDGALIFCVVGGGATGVEISGALAELLQFELEEDYPGLPVEKAEVHLYEMGPCLLGPFKPNLQEYTKKALEERGVRVHLGEGVVEIEPTRVHLKSGAVVKAHTLVWGAGIAGNPLAGSLGKELARGRLVAEPDLSLKDHPKVFVVGDIAMIMDSKTGAQLPQLGSVAMQAGTHAGANIARLVKGQGTEPFKYTDKGTMATIGRGAAIVQFRRGRTMTGRPAWLAWNTVHLMLLSGGDQRIRTFLVWGRDRLTWGRRKRVAAGHHQREGQNQ